MWDPVVCGLNKPTKHSHEPHEKLLILNISVRGAIYLDFNDTIVKYIVKYM